MAKIRYESGEADGATAVAHEFDTKASITNAAATGNIEGLNKE